jgi:hypothetical protein
MLTETNKYFCIENPGCEAGDVGYFPWLTLTRERKKRGGFHLDL